MNNFSQFSAKRGPLYQQIRDQLEAQIRAGTWKPGDLLPTEVELSEQFRVSVGTVKQAILALTREGLVYRQSGRGTFVNPLDRGHGLARFFRFRDTESGAELNPEIEVIDIEIQSDAGSQVAGKLGIEPSDPVLVIRRRMLTGDTPIGLYTSYLPYALVAGLEHTDLTNHALYDVLENALGIHVVSADESLRAVAATAETAARLSIPEGSPLIVIERIARTFNDVVIEWRRIAGRSDKFEYHAQLR